MRKILMMAVLAFLSLQGVGARASGISLLESGKKKLVAQEDTVKKDTVKKVTAYEKLLKDGGSECEGMFTVRHIKDDWYFEVPDSLLGRLLLVVTRFKAVPQGFKMLSGEEVNRSVVYWEQHNDKTLFLREYVQSQFARPGDKIAEALKQSTVDPVIGKFDVIGRNPETRAQLVNVSKFLLSDNKTCGFTSSDRSILGIGSLVQDRTFMDTIKTYPINVEVVTLRTYNITSGKLPAAATGSVTVKLNTSMVMLPKEPMQPRLADERVGFFQNPVTEFSDEQQVTSRGAIIQRYRLEPKDPERYRRGQLTEPKRPIVYYIDPATPKKWIPYLKAGVNDWNVAFEAAGFKNAIIAKEWPDDPTMSLDDARYSVLRYLPSETENAYGPRIVDPRSGEIMESHICWYHNVMNLLKKWYMVQCGPLDKRAQSMTFDDKLMGTLIQFVSSHEVGHTLGLRHNMAASSATPVEKLRDKAWVEANGHTVSIMDYARFNYVAQPEDKNVRLIPPLLGVYDIFMIKLGYAPIYDAETPADEYATLNKWIQEKAGDPMYTYGEQQILGTLDPASQSESLGDDAVKASRYGIKNLRYIMDHLVEWSAIENRPYDQTSELYYELTKQYQRYMGHCMAYIGGLYLNHPVAGDEQKGFVPVSREKQKEVVKFFFDEFKEQPKWMAKKEIMTLFEPNNDMVANLQANLLRNLLNSSTLGKVGMNAKYSERPYTQKEYLNDLYQGVWNKTEQGKALDYYDRNLQYAYVQYLLKELELTKDAEKSKGLSLELLTEDHLPCYGYEYHRHARQMSANTKISDLGISSKTLYYGQLVKLKELLKNRRHSASGDDKVHYDYLYFELNSVLK